MSRTALARFKSLNPTLPKYGNGSFNAGING